MTGAAYSAAHSNNSYFYTSIKSNSHYGLFYRIVRLIYDAGSELYKTWYIRANGSTGRGIIIKSFHSIRVAHFILFLAAVDI